MDRVGLCSYTQIPFLLGKAGKYREPLRLSKGYGEVGTATDKLEEIKTLPVEREKQAESFSAVLRRALGGLPLHDEFINSLRLPLILCARTGYGWSFL